MPDSSSIFPSLGQFKVHARFDLGMVFLGKLFLRRFSATLPPVASTFERSVLTSFNFQHQPLVSMLDAF
jgi:hypothetical protein